MTSAGEGLVREVNVLLSEFSFSCGLRDRRLSDFAKASLCGDPCATATYVGRESGGGGSPYTYLKAIISQCLHIEPVRGRGGAMGKPTQSVSLAYEADRVPILHPGHFQRCGTAGWRGDV